MVPDASTAVGRLIRLPLRVVPRGLIVPILTGPARGARWIVGAHTHGCWLGCYEAVQQVALARLLRPGTTVYDLGAHAGFYTLVAARRGARVVAVEPAPRNLRFLRRHVALNALHTVRVVEAAVSDQIGHACLRGDSALAHLAPEGQRVATITVDALARRYGPPALVKCDVEGAEVAVLRGAIATVATHRPTWLLSTHGASLRETCESILRRCGYAVSALTDDILLAQ